jgi:TolB protein
LTFEGKYNDSAALSPNGEWVAYATREDVVTQIVVMRPGGEDRRVVTDLSWRNSEDPSWAPDGRHLVFASDRSGASKLYVFDVVEGGFRQLTFGNDPDITPAWSY